MTVSFQDVSLFRASGLTPDGEVVPSGNEEETAFRLQRDHANSTISGLLPIGDIELSAKEQTDVQRYQQARLILGAAGAAPMVCAGPACTFAVTCPLVAIGKAPLHKLCPFELNYVTERFLSWMTELERTLETMNESERSAISNLVYIDIQEQRCLSTLAKAENASMVSRSVRDIDIETGSPICWEDVIHINRQILTNLTGERRGILKDFELTPEAKTKKQKYLGEVEDNNLARKQSNLFAQLRKNKALRMLEPAPIAAAEKNLSD